MAGKAKPKKHTAAEVKAKGDLHKPRGGGQAGQTERTPQVAITCLVCKLGIGSIAALKMHYESKHPKETLDEELYTKMKDTARAEMVKKSDPSKYKFTGKSGPSTL
jgi:hypothetical protein